MPTLLIFQKILKNAQALCRKCLEILNVKPRMDNFFLVLITWHQLLPQCQDYLFLYGGELYVFLGTPTPSPHWPLGQQALVIHTSSPLSQYYMKVAFIFSFQYSTSGEAEAEWAWRLNLFVFKVNLTWNIYCNYRWQSSDSQCGLHTLPHSWLSWNSKIDLTFISNCCCFFQRQ